MVQIVPMLFLSVLITSLILVRVTSVSTYYPNGSSMSQPTEVGDVLLHEENKTVKALSNNGWVVCNSPPQYRLPVTVRDCAILYHRYAAHSAFRTPRSWNAIGSPWTLSNLDEVCVLRLENYDHLRIDSFSPFDIFSATFRALGQCSQGYGGAASVGSEFFHASVAGAIPGTTTAEDQNVTLSLLNVNGASHCEI